MTADRPAIAVIIPLYNGPRFVTQALDSVFQQSLPATEVIIVDDGSTNGCTDIIARYAANYPQILLRNQNGNPASARNVAVQHSRANLIALLDQDDRWYPDHLSQLSLPFQTNTYDTLGWVYSNIDEITEDGSLQARAALSGSHPKSRLSECLNRDMFVLASASMISRHAFDAVGGFDEQLSDYQDDDLFVRLFAAGYRNLYINQPLAQRRVHTNNSVATSRQAHHSLNYARKLMRSFPGEPPDLIARRFLPQVMQATRAALRAGNPDAIDQGLQNISFLDHHISASRKLFPPRRHLLITTIIPLYNGAPFIQEAIQSIFDQVLVPDEIIIVDDGSTDTGPDIVAQMAQTYPIRLLRRENAGQSSARNCGVDNAHGDLIAFLDQDDVWYPDHLSELLKPFLKDRAVELGWAYSNLDEINEAGEMIARAFLSHSGSVHPKHDLASCLRRDMFVLPSASLISKKAFRSVGGFDERLSGYEDDDFFLRMFIAGFDNAYIPRSLSKWRIYQTSSSYTQRMAVSRAIYARKLINRFPNDLDRSRWHVRDIIAPRFFQTMAGELRRATLKGTAAQQKTALANLEFITGHLRLSHRLLLQTFVLPALHVPPLARFIMRHRIGLHNVLRRLFAALP